MGSFQQFEGIVKKMEEIASEAPAATNDNKEIVDIAADSLKYALNNFLTEKQVKDIVQTEVLAFSCNKEITLVTPTESKPLPNEPRHYLFKEILETVNLTI